ncbi:MAG: RNA-binding transcriptional accessory protein [Oscillospiraceae bacterium]|nr:RNA-binding transcriptional accessory protein [Oscillospiraceae bacterium]
MDILSLLRQEFSLKTSQVENTVRLIDDGNTIPFIARYRKELTGSLDDQVLRALHERLLYLRRLDEQREKVRASIGEQDKLTGEISASLDAAATLTEIDDIYRPFRQRRKTRASVAKARGLEPLADALLRGETDAAAFLGDEVPTEEDALQGARDILAERISDDANIRRRLRVVCMNYGKLISKAAKKEDSVYALYYDFSEPLNKMAGYRVLAINRGEREEFLKVSIDFDRARALPIVCDGLPDFPQVRMAAEDAYDRLIFPAIERELRNDLTEAASTAAIKVFSVNLRQLLLQPPIKGRVTIGLDPGYRTGCKVAVVDATGKVLDTAVIYPVPPHQKLEQAKEIIARLVDKYRATTFAIGNGTASHETEVFAADFIREYSNTHTAKGVEIAYMVVSEAGASVYSASPLAAQEFPEYDVSLRSAVSIARRLQDPLAELVKIDPQAIGVGQYQHDMPPAQLAAALDGTVEDCVNTVGVDLNTASAPLLARVAGVNAAVAKNIVAYREANGAFTSRAQLKKVPKLGDRAFLQCAGFLRIPESKNMLDNTAVHPESYDAAHRLLKLCRVEDLAALNIEETAGQLNIGVPTLRDIAAELRRPGRDMRDDLPAPLLRTDILGLDDLKAGMELKGTVRNVIDFGAFVDIGVHQDGLVHVSQMADRFVKHPAEVVKVGDVVNVRVLSVDREKKRIALSMKKG